MLNNIFYSYAAQWLAMVSGKAKNVQLRSDQAYWNAKLLKMFREHIPFSQLPELVGIDGVIFRKWLEHPCFDGYWQSIVPSEEDYAGFHVPVLTITGHYDRDQISAMHYYHAFMQYADEQARKNHYLVVGPWDHAGTRRPKRALGGLTFGDSAVLDMDRLHLEWFDWVLKEGDRPGFLKDNVAYYVMGRNQWRYGRRLEDLTHRVLKWYLSSDHGDASDVFHSGRLAPTPPVHQRPDILEYDPLDTSLGEDYDTLFFVSKDFLTRPLDVFSKGRLIYHSPPLEEDVELTGYVKLHVYLSMNVPDTDFWVDLYEITPRGESVFLTHDILRARYRTSLKKEELVKPGAINRYTFGRFYFFSRQLRKGSRLRLVIQCINSPLWQKNYNSGGVIAQETARDARKAVITLYHDENHPSYLEVPVAEGAQGDR